MPCATTCLQSGMRHFGPSWTRSWSSITRPSIPAKNWRKTTTKRTFDSAVLRLGKLLPDLFFALSCCAWHLITRRDFSTSSTPPSAGQGEIRGTTTGLPTPPHPGAFAGAELGGRTHPDVRAGGVAAPRQAGVHDGPDSDRPGALHCHGDRVERPGARRS